MNTINKEIEPPIIELGLMGWLRKNFSLIGSTLSTYSIWNLFVIYFNSSISKLDISLMQILLDQPEMIVLMKELAGFSFNKILNLYFMACIQLRSCGE